MCSQVAEPADGGWMPAVPPCAIETALQFSQLAGRQTLGLSTGADTGARRARHVHCWWRSCSTADAWLFRHEKGNGGVWQRRLAVVG